MEYFELMKGFLLTPVRTFQSVRKAGAGDALTYYLIILVINTILSIIASLIVMTAAWSVFSTLFTEMGIGVPAAAGVGILLVAILMIIIQLVMVVITALYLHIWVYVAGGRKGWIETLKAVTYGSTPFMLIGWIPFIGGIIGFMWSLVVSILGVRELQEISTAKAVIAVILAVVIFMLILITVAAFLLVAIVSSGPVPINSF
ncbi:MAG TPA: YIP1 family protein [Methanoregulaceae archaeon]|jgi:hypothetical protein|nr:YIP1 family protein [Methanoregulaceae archaeon]